MKYSLFFISVLIYLTNCNSNQTTQNSVDELITVESNNFDSNYITKPMERNFDSISFKWGEKRNIAVKDDSLLYFTIQSPTVLKYYTQTRYNYVDKIEYEGLNILQNKIDSAFHFCFNMNTKKLTIINITGKLPKLSEAIFLDSIKKHIANETNMGIFEVLRYKTDSDTFLIRYSKEITKHDENNHENKIDFSTNNYPRLGFYHNGKLSSIPHTFDGYLGKIYYWDSLGCGLIKYLKKGEYFLTFIEQDVFHTSPVQTPRNIGYIHTLDCKTYWSFNLDFFSKISINGEALETYTYTISGDKW